MANFDLVWKDTANFEKGFQNNPKDAGNYCKGALIGTNRGISAIGWAQYNKNVCPSITQIKNLSEAEAKKIAKHQYWDDIYGDNFKTQGIAHVAFDMAFGGSSGPLQIRETINKFKPGAVKEYRSMGLEKKEVDLINSFDQKKFFDALVARRAKYLATIQGFDGLQTRLDTLKTKYESSIVPNFTQKNTVVFAALGAVVLISIGLTIFIPKLKN